MTDEIQRIILFTGGMDSTYSLLKELSKGHRIHALYVSSENFPNNQSQKDAIEKIYRMIEKSELDETLLSLTISEASIPKQVHGPFPSTGISGLMMPCLILPHSLYLLNELMKNEIILSYTSEDDMVCTNATMNNLENIQTGLESLASLMTFNRGPDFKLEVKTPLINKTKKEIMNELLDLCEDFSVGSKRTDIITNLWFCENKYKILCLTHRSKDNYCPSCKKMYPVLKDLEDNPISFMEDFEDADEWEEVKELRSESHEIQI